MIKIRKMLSCLLITVFLILIITPLSSYAFEDDASLNTTSRSSRNIPNNEWPMFRGDLARTGNTTANGTDHYNLVWSLNNGVVYSSPVVQYDQIYIATTSSLKCYDLSGNSVWSFTSGADYGTPLVYNGRIYYAADNGQLYCLDANATGPGTTTTYWTYSPTGVRNCASSPVTDGKMVFYSTQHSSGLHAVWINNGSMAWTASLGGSDLTESSPAYWNGRVYCGGGYSSFPIGSDDMYCFNATNGNSIWTFNTGDDICATPTIEYGRVYFGSLDSKIYCVDAIGSGGSTTKYWEYNLGSIDIFASCAVGYGRVYIGDSGNTFRCLNALATGGTTTQYWSQTLTPTSLTGICSSAAINSKYVFVGTASNAIYCLNRTNGNIEWSNVMTPSGSSYGISSSPAVYKDSVIITSDSGYSYLIQPDKMCPTIVSTTPADSAIDVDIATNISVKFNESIDVSTLTPFSLILQDSLANQVQGTITADMSQNVFTAYYTPDSPLNKEETYTFTITTGVTDPRGNTLDGNGNGIGEGVGVDEYSITFTTALFSPPVIGYIPKQKLTEDIPKLLDLYSIISDPDTPYEELNITEDSDYAIIEGTNLNMSYPEGVTSDNINLTAQDNKYTIYKIIVVEITPVNDPPGVNPIGPLELVEDIPYSLNMQDNMTDIDTPYSELILSDNSSYTDIDGMWINFTYPEGVTYDFVNVTVYDGDLELYFGIQVYVEPVNDPPVIQELPALKVEEDIPFILSVENFISDVDTPINELEIIVVSPYVEVSGFILTLTYPEKIKNDHLDVQVFDGENYDNSTLVVTVKPVNDPPKIISIISPQEGDVYEYNTTIDLLAIVTDADLPYGDTLEFLWYDHKRGAIGDEQNITGVVLEPGDHLISFTVTDQEGSRDSVNINVTVKKEEVDEPEPEPDDNKTEPTQPDDTDEPKKSTSEPDNLMWLMMIIIIVIIIIALLAGFFVMKRKKKAKEEQKPEQPVIEPVAQQMPQPQMPMPPFPGPPMMPQDFAMPFPMGGQGYGTVQTTDQTQYQDSTQAMPGTYEQPTLSESDTTTQYSQLPEQPLAGESSNLPPDEQLPLLPEYAPQEDDLTSPETISETLEEPSMEQPGIEQLDGETNVENQPSADTEPVTDISKTEEILKDKTNEENSE